MGIYLNPGNENFKMILAAPIYVDKSMMIQTLNRFIDQGNSYICVSRPRRFGKTIAGNMISAYYSKGADSEELFSNLAIASTEGYIDRLNQYNVIKIDMNGEYQTAENRENVVKNLIRKIKKEFRSQYQEIVFDEEASLAEMMLDAYTKTGIAFIIIIDEYDVLVREQVDDGLFEEYLSFLNGLFKNETLRPAIAMAYLTGILPVVRDRVQSKLNNFEEYTILDAGELAEFVGFIEPEVRTLCSNYGVDFEECRRWYDGYSQHGFEIYNPESVVKCLVRKRFDNYWGKTSTYRVIADQISRNYEGIRNDVIHMLAGESVPAEPGIFMNTVAEFKVKDEALAYLIHVGYLSYDFETGMCRIPNQEILREWQMAISVEDEYAQTDRIIKASKQLLEDTLSGYEEAVAKALDVSHIHVTSNRSYNNEDALQSAIYLAYIYALNQYTVVKEMTTGKGFADVLFIPFVDDKPALIIELKHNKSAESAIDQIRRKQYYDSLEHYHGSLLFVGINYDEQEKSHRCRIERFVKE